MNKLKLIYLVPYYMFNMVMGIVIGLITYAPRLIIEDLRGYPVKYTDWLDKYFPLPPDNLF
jgi:hypothetical protein